MKKSFYLAICCSLYCALQCIGCQMGSSEGPISTKLGFRDVPKQTEPPIESEEVIESSKEVSSNSE